MEGWRLTILRFIRLRYDRATSRLGDQALLHVYLLPPTNDANTSKRSLLFRAALRFDVDTAVGMLRVIPTRDTQELLKIGCAISCDWVPARSCVPTGEWHKRSGKIRIDVDPGAATRSAVNDVRQAFVPHTVDERVQKPKRRLAMDDSITVQVRHNRCKGWRGSTSINHLAGVIWGQLIYLTWSHQPEFQYHGQRL